MACEVPIWDIKTRVWRSCCRSGNHTAETLLNNALIRKRCCKQHLKAAIDDLVQTGAHDVHGQLTPWRLKTQIVNAQVRVVGSDGTESFVSRATVEFGPKTELDSLYDLHDRFQNERLKIGLFAVNDSGNDSWRERYDVFSNKLKEIDDQIACLQI